MVDIPFNILEVVISEPTAGQAMGLMKFSTLQNDALPDEVRQAVREELGRRRARTGHN